ncbi:lipoprotein-releasing ABC transporter permease subunit [Rickettsiales bacterium]|nr:lipoprotein-releasing ABC transporter permease subunit [Rickettsiales bacterium]
MSKLELLIAFRYLRSKRKEGFISVITLFSFIGIIIGVATLIIVMSVMNGFHHELVGRILGINSHITIQSYQKDSIKNYSQIIDNIKQLPNIKSANPMVESQVMFNSKFGSSGGLARGIKRDDLEKKELIKNNLIAGKFYSNFDKDKIIMGSNLAQNLNLTVGDKVKIISATTNKTILGNIPRIKTYEISGIFQTGLYEYDLTMIFMPFKAAQIHFKHKDSASHIEIFGNDLKLISNIKYDIYKILKNDITSLNINDWQDANRSFIDALKIERTVMFLILTLIILVAAFNIISSLIMLVNDKKKNIACLRVMGMTRSNIVKIFLIAGGMIGFFGTILGLIIGVLFSKNINAIKEAIDNMTQSTLFDPAIYFLSHLPSKVFISDVILIVLMSIFISFFATIYPALKASKTNPAEILK